MSGVRFDRTGKRCIIAFDIFICLLNFFYSELKSSGAIVVPNTSNYAINSCYSYYPYYSACDLQPYRRMVFQF